MSYRNNNTPESRHRRSRNAFAYFVMIVVSGIGLAMIAGLAK